MVHVCRTVSQRGLAHTPCEHTLAFTIVTCEDRAESFTKQPGFGTPLQTSSAVQCKDSECADGGPLTQIDLAGDCMSNDDGAEYSVLKSLGA